MTTTGIAPWPFGLWPLVIRSSQLYFLSADRKRFYQKQQNFPDSLKLLAVINFGKIASQLGNKFPFFVREGGSRYFISIKVFPNSKKCLFLPSDHFQRKTCDNINISNISIVIKKKNRCRKAKKYWWSRKRQKNSERSIFGMVSPYFPWLCRTLMGKVVKNVLGGGVWKIGLGGGGGVITLTPCVPKVNKVNKETLL